MSSSSKISALQFVDLLDETMICFECNNVVDNAMQVKCGCRLCKHCVDKLIDCKDTCRCLCLKYWIINDSLVEPDYAARRKLKDSHVKCTYWDRGCLETVTFTKFEQHVADCAYRTSCQYCCKPVRQDMMPEHHKSCEKVPTSCQACGHETTIGELAEHKSTTCEMEIVNCELAYAGCPWNGTRIEKSAHETPSHTIQQLGQYARTTQNTVDELKDHLKIIKDANIVLNKDMLSFVRKVTDLETRLSRQTTTGASAVSMAATASAASAAGASYTSRHNTSYNDDNPPSYDQAVVILPPELRSAMIPSSSSSVIPIDIDAKVNVLEKFMESLETRINLVETTSYDGTLVWIINDYSKHFLFDRQGTSTSIFSQYFYKGFNGFKIRLRLYPNGDGAGYGTHMSLYIQIGRHTNDAVQKWPFNHKVTLSLIDQINTNDLSENFAPTKSTCFDRPVSENNSSIGFPVFVPHTTLYENSKFWQKDKIIIKAVVH